MGKSQSKCVLEITMLLHHLQEAISDLDKLIVLTKDDIADIAIANNEAIFARNEEKKTLIKSFETNKSLLESQMREIINNNPDTPMSELLDSQVDEGLERLKSTLKTLKDINTSYAESVFAVGEFYTSLLKALVPYENHDYTASKPKSHILDINA